MNNKEIDQQPSKEAIQRKRKSKRKILLVTLSAGFSLLLVCLTLEVGLRMCHVSFPSYYTPDEHVASRLRPGARGWWTKEGHAWFEVNSLGMRDEPRSVEKPDDVYRIAVLGDSFMEAAQVSVEDCFTQRLQRLLNERNCVPSKRVEVLNFGVSGYGTAQELLTLKHRVWQFNPDEVLLAVLPGNDIRNNSKELEPEVCLPFFNLVDGRLVLDNSFRTCVAYVTACSTYDQVKTRIVNSSASLQFLREAKTRIFTGRIDSSATTDIGTGLRASVAATPYLYRPPNSQAATEAWAITEMLLGEIDLECKAHNVPWSLMVISTSVETYPNTDVRREIARDTEIEDLHYAANRFSEWAKSSNVPCVALGPLLQQHVTDREIYVRGFTEATLGAGHWNENGHALASKAVADRMCDRQ